MRRRTGWRGRGCFPRTSRSCSPPATSTRPGRPPTSWRRSPTTSTRRCCARWPPTPRGPSCSPRATPQAALAALRRCVDGLAGARGAVRSRAGPASSSGSPAGSSATRTAAEMELDAARWVFEQPRRGTRPRASAVALREGGGEAGGRADRARAGGAPPGGGRQDQPRDRRRAVPQREDGRPPRQQHLHQAGVCRPGRRPPPTPTSTTSSSAPTQNHPSARACRSGCSPDSGDGRPLRSVAIDMIGRRRKATNGRLAATQSTSRP